MTKIRHDFGQFFTSLGTTYYNMFEYALNTRLKVICRHFLLPDYLQRALYL
jgi:hypothetical protein